MKKHEMLDAHEYQKLQALFDECDYADPEDIELYTNGNHRKLFDYLCHLGTRPPFGRGPVYYFAAKLLAENEEHWKERIMETLRSATDDIPLLDYAEYFLQ